MVIIRYIYVIINPILFVKNETIAMLCIKQAYVRAKII